MDFNFGFILGTAANGGCAIGEAFVTAAMIAEGDGASWQEQWIATARRLEAKAEASWGAGHGESALGQFQRAAYAYRAGILAMLPDDPRFRETARAARDCLRRAGELMRPKLEYAEIPFEGTVLPVFFRKAAAGDQPTKTLLMIGGGETFAEDLFFHIAPQAFARGYNFVTVDLPGQGLLPLEGKTFRPAMHVPMKALVDHVLGRPDVDPERLFAYGISGGGGFVPQAAMHDPRIRAVAVTSAVVDAEKLFATMPVASATPDVVEAYPSFHRNIVKMVAWRWGVSMDHVPGLVGANRGFSFDPAKIAVPMLLLVGEDEFRNAEVRRQQEECLAKLPHPLKRLVITPAILGAGSHCLVENRSLMAEELFNWFEEVLEAIGRAHPGF